MSGKGKNRERKVEPKYQSSHRVSAAASRKERDGSVNSVSFTLSSPYVPPQIVTQYNQIEPGLGTKLVHEGIEQSKHRRKIEDKVINSNVYRSWAGLVVGAGLVVFLGILGYNLAMASQTVIASIIFTTTIASIAAIYYTGKTNQAKELIQKKDTMKELQTQEPAERPQLGEGENQ